ncbi:MAG: putative phosphoesterase [Candidatus Azotimanducaceae bacterium]|jgi:putative phosphoesterase
MKVGLIADTHMPGSIESLWPQVTAAFSDVDVILHAGDLHTLDVVDELCRLAPTYVAMGNGDVGIVDDRLQETWLLDLAGVKVGMIHHFPSPARKSPEVIAKRVDRHFEERPDIVIFGHTHFEGIYQVNDMLYVNPGSPTLPRNQSLRMGTIGEMEISDSEITIIIHQITEAGLDPHGEIEHLTLPR